MNCPLSYLIQTIHKEKTDFSCLDDHKEVNTW